jgi:RNA polymerase sigma factor (sigma-70 family)
VSETTVPARPPNVDRAVDRAGPAAEFEQIYRSQVGAVTAFFARRSADPQTVADLTADTFLNAITGFASFDPARGTARAWLFGIARKVFAKHCDAHSRRRDIVVRLAGRGPLPVDEIDELLARIDAERGGRVLVEALADLPEIDREVLELVDIAGLAPKEAALALGIAPGALRIRLHRARTRLRKLGAAKGEKGEDNG